jgi:hypothetical protein
LARFLNVLARECQENPRESTVLGREKRAPSAYFKNVEENLELGVAERVGPPSLRLRQDHSGDIPP